MDSVCVEYKLQTLDEGAQNLLKAALKGNVSLTYNVSSESECDVSQLTITQSMVMSDNKRQFN